MYTLSIRPATNPGRRSFNTCMNFTQASMSWEQSTFSEDSRDAKEVNGVVVHSPLESVDISVKELAAAIAGIYTAYDDLCKAAYSNIVEGASVFGITDPNDLISFLRLGGPVGALKALPMDGFEKKVSVAMPFLYHRESNSCVAYTYAGWERVVVPESISSYDSAGTFLEWEVMYSEDVMNTSPIKNVEDFVEMFRELLKFIPLDSDERVYVASRFPAD